MQLVSGTTAYSANVMRSELWYIICPSWLNRDVPSKSVPANIGPNADSHRFTCSVCQNSQMPQKGTPLKATLSPGLTGPLLRLLHFKGLPDGFEPPRLCDCVAHQKNRLKNETVSVQYLRFRFIAPCLNEVITYLSPLSITL